MSLEILSPSDQVANHLRNQLRKGTWLDFLPGTPALCKELEVDRKTITAALQKLEDEGLLKARGSGRSRRIVLPEIQPKSALNIQLILYEDSDREIPFILEIAQKVRQLGHEFTIAPKTLHDFKMNANRVSRYATQNPADAWIITGGSREVLEWFAGQEAPAFAIFGRRRQVKIPSVGPDKTQAMKAAVQRLFDLGHRRIVCLAREERRFPTPGRIEQQFLQELRFHGIIAGPYHLPNWPDHPKGFEECLRSLFQHTPPTALIIDEAHLFTAAQLFLAQRNITAPRDVSMICCDMHPVFNWCRPQISHIDWPAHPVVKRTVQWVNQLSQGHQDRKAHHTPAKFFEGGTIGPVPIR